MHAIKTHPKLGLNITSQAMDLMMTGFRKCDRSKNNRCIVSTKVPTKNYCVTMADFETVLFIVTVEQSLTEGEFVVTMYDENGAFVASARCDKFDK